MTTAPLGSPSFDELVLPHQRALLAHCYRMTGSLPDAEDALQDTMLRAWRSLDAFEGRSSVRTWLFTIATNVCRRHLEQRGRRMLPVDLGPPSDPNDRGAPALEESSWITPFASHDDDASPAARYESKESVELAFITALQVLPPRQRAVLLLRDVLAFSAAETAQALDTTSASVNSALQRARRLLAERELGPSQQQVLRSVDGTALLEGFMRAWERRDVEALVALLADDVEFSMPPEPMWFRGVHDVVSFLRAVPLAPGRDWLARPVQANGQLAFALWMRGDEGFGAHSINVLSLSGRSVSGLAVFRTAALFPAFDLPMTLP